MKVIINLKKSLQENASLYFDAGKKSKRKLIGLEKALLSSEKRKSELEEKAARLGDAKAIMKRKKNWFEKFHWCNSSDGFLIIGGRDAKSNEIVVKRHMEKDDLYFHAEIQGAPHVIVKADGKKVSEATKKEAAEFAAAFSKAWREKIPAIDVYSVSPEQVSKNAPSGEALGTGAFMIYGEREYFKKTALAFATGLIEEEGSFIVISGPESAVKKQTKHFLRLKQGPLEKGAAAKKIKQILERKIGGKNPVDLDEINSMLPNGGIEIRE
ncbi:MAG: NFACT RNA binding domain-containing protein [Candidatus Diapherotrites archaeon]